MKERFEKLDRGAIGFEVSLWPALESARYCLSNFHAGRLGPCLCLQVMDPLDITCDHPQVQFVEISRKLRGGVGILLNERQQARKIGCRQFMRQPQRTSRPTAGMNCSLSGPSKAPMQLFAFLFIQA